MGPAHERRQVLGLVAGASAVVFAGCSGASGNGSDGTGTERSTEADRPTESATETATETATTTPDPAPTMSTVFHFAASTGRQKHALANVANLLDDASTDVENVVFVANGRGIKLLASSTSEFPDRVTELADRGVSFRACENSMDAFDVDDADLVDGVETVPAGVGELTKLQARDDFAYIETP
jgi:hypothetical protein